MQLFYQPSTFGCAGGATLANAVAFTVPVIFTHFLAIIQATRFFVLVLSTIMPFMMCRKLLLLGCLDFLVNLVLFLSEMVWMEASSAY